MKRLLIIVAILFWAGVSWGATYNIGPGQTYTTFAALVAGETLAAGDIVDGGGNTFTEVWTIPTSGSIGNPITFRNATVWEIFGNSQDYITIQGLTVTGNVHASGDNWVIDRVVCDGDAQTLTFKSTDAAVDMDVTTTGGSVLWAWGDESSSAVADPGAKNFVGAATRYNSISASDNWANVTQLQAHGSAIAFDLAQMVGLQMTGVLNLSSTSVAGDIADLPRGLTDNLNLSTTSVSGDIADLPSGLNSGLYLSITSVSGDIADLPSGLANHIYLSNTSVSDYSASSWPCNTGNGKTIDFTSLSGLDQTEVDNILCHLDTHGATGGTLKLGGTTAPSAAGITCRDNLVAKGWGVTLTP
jgi:hypothetical protein